MFEEALSIGEKVLKKCDGLGIESTELFFSYNNTKMTLINGTSISSQRSRDELGVGIRVIHKGSQGFTYTNIITPEAILKCAKDAFTVAKLSPAIPGMALPEKQKIKPIAGTFNKDLANLEISEIIQDAQGFIDGFTSVDKRIQSILSSVQASTNGRAILNSNGISAERKYTSYQASFLLVASDKEKAGSYVFDNFYSRKPEFDSQEFGVTLGKKAIDNLNQQSLKEFDGPIIFRESAVLSPVGMVAALAVSADQRQRGASFWKDKLGDKVADERFNLIDKPTDLQAGNGVKAFDDEGNPTAETEIVKDGVLQTFLHNQRTANKEKLQSTGNAIRNAGALPAFAQPPSTILPNSPWIAAGNTSEEEMIAETKKGLIVHNYQGTIRYENGIFSGVAKGAYLIENGEITKPVTGISISGNVFDLLNNIECIGKEYHLASNYARVPYIKFKGIKVTTN